MLLGRKSLELPRFWDNPKKHLGPGAQKGFLVIKENKPVVLLKHIRLTLIPVQILWFFGNCRASRHLWG